jgi:short subunit dehydrogenase-like uncharacterized protein
MRALLIYGATGYTGELVARRAVADGLRPILAARHEAAVAALAGELGLAHRAFALDRADAIDLSGVGVMLSCAGPFSETAGPLVDACLRERAHYLDITGEAAVFESVAARDAEAIAAGVMLLPGVGFDVVPTDCLAAHLAARLPTATELRLAFTVSGRMSRGTALTSLAGAKRGGLVRRDGALVRVPVAHRTIAVDFGSGARVPAVAIPWGDVFTAHVTTRIPNIEVYAALPRSTRAALRASRWLGPLVSSGPVRRLAEKWVRARVKGPSAQERAAGETRIWGEARDAAGATVVSRLRTPEPYQLTVETAVAIAKRALDGDAAVGFQTPARAYGADFVLGFDGVSRQDEPSGGPDPSP